MPILEQFISSFFNFVAFPSTSNTARSIGKHTKLQAHSSMGREQIGSSITRPSSQNTLTTSMDLDHVNGRQIRRERTLSARSTMSGSSEEMQVGIPLRHHLASRNGSQREAVKGNLKAKLRRSSSTLTSSPITSSSSSGDRYLASSNRRTNSVNHRPAKSRLGSSSTTTHSVQGSSYSAHNLSKASSPITKNKPSFSRTRTSLSQPKPAAKDLKRKRSSSSVSSLANISFGSLSSKLYGFMAKSPKRARLTEEHAKSRTTTFNDRNAEKLYEEGRQNDIHRALRSGGVRLVGTSIDFDGMHCFLFGRCDSFNAFI